MTVLFAVIFLFYDPFPNLCFVSRATGPPPSPLPREMGDFWQEESTNQCKLRSSIWQIILNLFASSQHGSMMNGERTIHHSRLKTSNAMYKNDCIRTKSLCVWWRLQNLNLSQPQHSRSGKWTSIHSSNTGWGTSMCCLNIGIKVSARRSSSPQLITPDCWGSKIYIFTHMIENTFTKGWVGRPRNKLNTMDTRSSS
jgi:hypothetical protein